MRAHIKNKQAVFYLVLILSIAAGPLLAIAAPRALAYLAPVSGLLLFIAHRFAFGEKAALLKPLALVLAGVAALAFLSALWSVDLGDSVSRSVKLALTSLGGALFVSVAHSIPIAAIKKYLWLVSASLFLACVLFFIELNTGYPLHLLARGEEFGARVSEAAYNRAAVSIALLLFPTVLILTRYIKPWQAATLSAICAALVMISTESQSAQLGLIVGLLACFLYPARWKHGWKVIAGLLAVLMFAAPFISVWTFNNFAPAIHAHPYLGEGGAYGGGRLSIWNAVSLYALQNPLYGFGIEATRNITDFDFAQIYQERDSVLHPHNFALQLWMEFGVIGAAAGAAFLAFVLKLISATEDLFARRLIIGAFFASLLVASTGYGMWQGWWLGLLFTLAGLSVLAARFQREQA